MLRCPCGFLHDLSPIPDDGWLTIRDKDYEELLSVEAKRSELASAKEGTEEMDRLMLADKTLLALYGIMYECPKCARIMWQKPGEETFRVYLADMDNTVH